MKKMGRNHKIEETMAYFPMFVNIENQNCLVVGGGMVAFRKVQVLLDFGACVTVIARKVHERLKEKFGNCAVIYEREFVPDDLQGMMLVVAATDDKEENHVIAELAGKARIPVNAVDQKEDCSFIFPSYIRKQNVVGAFSSGGNSPVLTQYLKDRMTDILDENLGEINEYMGSVRDVVKARVQREAERREVYREVLATLLSDGKTSLSEDELQQIIKKRG